MLPAVTAARFFVTPAGAAVILNESQPAAPEPISIPIHPAKFDAAFIERRMREHRAWQEQTAIDLEYDIVREVLAAERRGQQ